MSLPEPPINVRLVLRDGTVRSVDTVYEGFVDGSHLWAVVDSPPWWLVKQLLIEALPPKTSVTFGDEPDTIVQEQGGNDT